MVDPNQFHGDLDEETKRVNEFYAQQDKKTSPNANPHERLYQPYIQEPAKDESSNYNEGGLISKLFILIILVVCGFLLFKLFDGPSESEIKTKQSLITNNSTTEEVARAFTEELQTSASNFIVKMEKNGVEKNGQKAFKVEVYDPNPILDKGGIEYKYSFRVYGVYNEKDTSIKREFKLVVVANDVNEVRFERPNLLLYENSSGNTFDALLKKH